MSASIEKLIAELLAFALELPEAWEDHPWGENVAKVRKKVFVFFGTGDKPRSEFGFAVKLPESGREALLLPFCEPCGYGLGKSGWVTVKIRSGEVGLGGQFRAWIVESYRAVALKSLVKQLDARTEGVTTKSAGKKKVAKAVRKKKKTSR